MRSRVSASRTRKSTWCWSTASRRTFRAWFERATASRCIPCSNRSTSRRSCACARKRYANRSRAGCPPGTAGGLSAHAGVRLRVPHLRRRCGTGADLRRRRAHPADARPRAAQTLGRDTRLLAARDGQPPAGRRGDRKIRSGAAAAPIHPLHGVQRAPAPRFQSGGSRASAATDRGTARGVPRVPRLPARVLGGFAPPADAALDRGTRDGHAFKLTAAGGHVVSTPVHAL